MSLTALLLAAATPASDAQAARIAAEARLAEARAPLARMSAALVRASRRPPALTQAAARDGDARRRLHATLAALWPAIEAQVAAARAETQRADARLDRALLPADSGEEGAALDALIEALDRDAAATARLARFDAPPPRPGTPSLTGAPRPPYRLPIAGRVLAGAGEIAPTGVRTRGLVLATARGTPVIAPAAGEIAYAGPFRRWPAMVIIRHGHGWASVITGLDRAAVKAGGRVAAGAPLGSAGRRVEIELRHDGRAIDVTAMAEEG